MTARIANDLSIYEDHAEEWWEPDSYYFRSLQSITPLRLALIRRWFGEVRGKRILDLGCGGGFLTVPLERLGAQMIGVDLSFRSLAVAGSRSAGRTRLICADLKNWPIGEETADAAVLADVIDHICEYPLVLKNVARSLRPGGKLFISTINRTFWSWLLAIKLGEGLGLIPKGTHDHALFVRPEELQEAADRAGLIYISMTGERLEWTRTIRRWTVMMSEGSDTSVSYSALFEKKN